MKRVTKKSEEEQLDLLWSRNTNLA